MHLRIAPPGRRRTITATAALAAGALALAPPALAHQTAHDGPVAVTVHVAPDDAPTAGDPATVIIAGVKVRKGKFSFKSGKPRLRISDSSGDVLLSKRVGKRTSFTFPAPARTSSSSRAAPGAAASPARSRPRSPSVRTDHQGAVMSKSPRALVALSVAGAVLALPAVAGAHATVSALKPQGPALTSARTTYVMVAPNETANLFTSKMTLLVPEAIQESFSVAQSPDWKVRLTREKTGATDEEGNPVMKTTVARWYAKRNAAFGPGFFGQWLVRFQNPASPQKLCFPIHQQYRSTANKRKSSTYETVYWTGPATAEHPASCVDIVSG